MIENLTECPITAAVVVLLVTLVIIPWLRRRWKYNYPPGPFSLPFVGNLWQFDVAKLHEKAFELRKTYGPVLTIKLGSMPVIFVNTLEPALEVLVKRSTEFAARMRTPSVDVATYGGKDIAFSSYGPTWKLQRRLSSKALRKYMQGDSLEKKVHDAMKTAVGELDKQTDEFDPEEYTNFITVNILYGLCFGGKFDFHDEEVAFLRRIDDEFVETFGVGTPEDVIPGLKYVYKSQGYRKLEQLAQEMCEDFLRKKFIEAKETFDKDSSRHFTDLLLQARVEAEEEEDEATLKSLSEDHLILTLFDVFFAGIDSSRYTINFSILHMIAFPDIQKKVQQEIDRVVGKERLPSVKDRSDLSYTEAVLHESMRLSSIAPTGVFHMAACDTEVAGYKIPKGTNVAVNFWGLHHDPDAWEDVDKFVPERFLDGDGKLGPKPKHWLPFSAGTRVCLGEFVAKPELLLIFASLMQRYRWSMKSGKYPDLGHGGNMFGLSNKPNKVIATKRI